MLPGFPGGSVLAGIVARFRSLWRGARRRDEVEAEMTEEFRHHIELRTEALLSRGLAPEAAARRARIEFGHVEGHKADARASRGLDVLDRIGFSWLDLKLGVRMLGKYPGLSLVSVIGMAVAIAIAGGGFGLIYALIDAPLPLDEGERIVFLQNSDTRNAGNPDRHSTHDFVLWRTELGSVRDLSAFTTESRTLTIPHRGSADVRVALMTASGFRVARVAPMLGRPLLDADERAGAPPVVVIAYDEWQRRFGADPRIIGTTVRLDTVVYTVAGVMPEAFRFPVDHHYWVPLPLDPTAYDVGGGPQIDMFGRLADGATIERAQAELDAIGQRMAAAHPRTHEHLRPWVRPYTHPFIGIDSPARALLVRSIQVGLGLLLIVVAVNVAILVYARTAARTGEIAVRTVLGASRRRIVTQLFAEALVLSSLAAVIGMGIAAFAFDLLRDLLTGGGEGIPFWVDFSLSPALVAYVAALAVLAAAIVGVVPALKATGRSVQGSLQDLSTRGSRMQLGRTWTTLIIAQVACAVGILPYALWGGGRLIRSGAAEPDYPRDAFLQASLSIERTEASGSGQAAPDAALASRFAATVAEVVRRLDAEPEVESVTFASYFPGSEQSELLEVEGTGERVWEWVNEVDIDLFTVFDIPILAGRGFVPSDASPSASTIIVDQVFADVILGGGNVLGRRVRRLERVQSDAGVRWDEGPWLEIIGVVPAFTPPPPFEATAPKIYQPLSLADAGGSVRLAVRMKPSAEPAAFLGRVREITRSLDPLLRLTELQTATEAERLLRKGLLSMALSIIAVTGSVLLLSAAGIYAMMSFTVASRRREIGIRSALGAAPRSVLAGIFKRAGAQLGAGVVAGLLLAEAVPRVQGGSFFAGEGMLTLIPVIAIVLAIGFAAAFGPARRGLAIQPIEALREE